VPADDQVTSLTGVGPAAAGQNSGIAFTTTHWSVVLTAQGESPAAREALEKLCRIYWRPVYTFIRRQGIGPEEAEDLTQGFFALLLERRDFDAVRKEKGRLRSYLLTCLKHFLASARRREMTVKRGKGQRLVPLEELSEIERTQMEPRDPLSADRLYERRWALTLMEQVMRRLKEKYCTAGNAALFDSLKQLLSKALADKPFEETMFEDKIWLHFTLGLSQERAGNVAAARATYQQAVQDIRPELEKVAPGHSYRETELHEYLGLAYAGLGEAASAIAEGQKAMAADPTSKDPLEGPRPRGEHGEHLRSTGGCRSRDSHSQAAAADTLWGWTYTLCGSDYSGTAANQSDMGSDPQRSSLSGIGRGNQTMTSEKFFPN